MIYNDSPHLFDCESPVRIRNKYTHQVLFVPCGSCPSCVASKIVRPVTPIMRESTLHKYTVFFTLTYADFYLPKCNLLNYVPHPDFKEKYEELFTQSEDFLKLCNYNLPYCCVSDIQKFCKRLRKVFQTYSEQLRYYISSDYGSTTFRPHWHGLLFFNSEQLANSIESIISKVWSVRGTTIGKVDVQFARGAAAYVACYIHQVPNLPAIYKFREFRPKSVHSSCPPLGFDYSFVETYDDVIRYGLTEVTMYDVKKFIYHKTAVLPSVVRRLFPIIPCFNGLHKHERMEIYRIMCNASSCLDVLIRRNYLHHVFNVNSFFRDYVLNGNMYYSLDSLNRRLDVIYYTVCRLVKNCEIYDYSLCDYDDKIMLYLKNRWLSSYRKQVDYFNNHPGLNYEDVLTLNIKPYEYDLNYFVGKTTLLESLVKRKLNNSYLELHPEFKQFHF